MAAVAIEGTVRSDVNTKRLLRSLQPGEIALIRHEDLDDAAAEGLLQAGAKAVVNAAKTLTGSFPHDGPMCLLRAGVPIYEIADAHFETIPDGTVVSIRDGLLVGRHIVIPCAAFTYERMADRLSAAERNYPDALFDFAHNTIKFAERELASLLAPVAMPELRKPVKHRPVLIVSRGRGYKDDLAALRDYIAEARPVLFGVDGGADALLEQGLRPDVIIGDMDSVSDEALRCGAQLLVHAYADGRAPGMDRIAELGLYADAVAVPGTSEDAAMRIAYGHHAERIVIVGGHVHPIDFMEKGRGGMASTLLVRMLLGDKLVDARGAGLWLQPRKRLLHRVPERANVAEGGRGG
ncbi:hypothetical protein DLM86_10885 [Paenibacillus flagellatus]|uniref:Thiamin pyrophosphokinase catalytic domain-containing protein n=2 Tax=Paenibacillus flagellatus TaxID=2211139 RepID=A0A2V5K6X1_9BACL|nr:hypothetical protein DLM86_10885 [Paenibacillus flagellatus]